MVVVDYGGAGAVQWGDVGRAPALVPRGGAAAAGRVAGLVAPWRREGSRPAGEATQGGRGGVGRAEGLDQSRDPLAGHRRRWDHLRTAAQGRDVLRRAEQFETVAVGVAGLTIGWVGMEWLWLIV